MIRNVDQKDIKALSQLAGKFHLTLAESLVAEFQELLDNKNAQVLVLEINNKIEGFSQIQLRYDYVEGCKTSPVGYLEGIYVSEKNRKRGHATKMLEEGKAWAKEKGCREFASDTELDNEVGFLFHKHNGFTQTNRLITFKQDL
jgi:aminoglycoside 6'-N-acetyltransferase I